MPSLAWIEDVLQDLKTFCNLNELKILEAALDEALASAASETGEEPVGAVTACVLGSEVDQSCRKSAE